MATLDIPDGMAKYIRNVNNVYQVRFPVKIKGDIETFIGWRAVHSDHKLTAAMEAVINPSNAAKIQAKLIAEAANGPVTFAAETILKEKGVIIIPDVYLNAGGVTVSYFEWIKNLSHIRFGRMNRRYEEGQSQLLIQAKENTGNKVPQDLVDKLSQGSDEVALVRPGLDDTMRRAFQGIRERYWSNDKVPNYRIAAMSIAIEKIHISYSTMGIYP